VVLGDEIEDRLVEAASSLSQKTDSRPWQRPKKTQTATQWAYIAQTAIRIAEELGVDLDQVSATLADRFGYSCVPTLRAVVADADADAAG
jgi:hypothetical protein